LPVAAPRLVRALSSPRHLGLRCGRSDGCSRNPPTVGPIGARLTTSVAIDLLFAGALTDHRREIRCVGSENLTGGDATRISHRSTQ
jgi:hypothetical protein